MRKYFTKRNVFLLILVLLVGFFWWRNNNNKNSTKVIKTATVTKGTVVSSVTISVEVGALKEAVLNFPSSGKLSYIGVKNGDLVSKGQLLASLDLGDLQAAETKAWYTYLAYDAAAKKVEDDMKGKGASENFTEKSTRVTAQTNRDIAYDSWLSAQRAVRNAKLWSPFKGVVTNTTISAIGDTVSTVDGVTVVDPESLYFSGEVDESDVGKIALGMKVEIKLDAFEDKVFEGYIEEIGYSAKTSSTGATVFEIRIKFNSFDVKMLRLGMNGDAKIILRTVDNVLKLPFEAVVDGEVVMADQPEIKKKVEVGIEGETDVEIISGLNEGDNVIIK